MRWLNAGWIAALVLMTSQAAWAEVDLSLQQRKLVTLRATLKGESPAERVEAAEVALAAALAAGGPGLVSRERLPGEPPALRLLIDGRPIVHLVAEDLGGIHADTLLDAAAADAEHRLRLAVAEWRESRDPRRLGVAVAWSFGASLVALLLLRGGLALRRRLLQALHGRIVAPAQVAQGTAPWWRASSDGLLGLLRWLTGLLSWGLALLLADLWASFVLHQFAYTRPWGERATHWLLELLAQFFNAALSALPGLLTALLIFLMARAATRLSDRLLQRVERGELSLGSLDAETAGPTARLVKVLLWLFALAMAYPYLPGAGSEAFKGVSVLAGLMLSLGASSVVGQALSGIGLMYTRVLRAGEYVRIGDIEGTVAGVGLFSTRLHTGLSEELSIPNALVFGQPVRNLSRLVNDGRFVLHTVVTIGYATPWRQVHAMLLEAARRTPGVAAEPPPHVVQTALSDFYVEYRLCAQGTKAAPRSRAEAISQLHANVQDVFNENGVQIMSPHYEADPAAEQVVAAGPWFQPAAAPLAPNQPASS
jgi:small-conductance mechanosensitive channel